MRSLVLALMLTSSIAAAQVTPSTFTYQGRLVDQGQAITGNVDLQFTLYSAETGGSVVGSPITRTNVSVADGLFSAPLDFGIAALNSGGRYVSIAVRSPAGSGAYATLTPRQALTSAPFAAITDGISRPDASTVNLIGVGMGPEYTDVSVTNVLNAFLTTTSPWQSFTPVSTGKLTGLSVHFLGGGSISGTLEIYTGDGIAGTPIYSQNVSFGVGAPARINVTGDCPLTTGQIYTWRIVTNVTCFPVFNSDVYSGGRSYYTGANADLYFITYMRSSGVISALSVTPSATHVSGELSVASRVRLNGASASGHSLSIGGFEWLRFASPTGGDWHINNIGNGVNFAQTNVADYRLFLAPGGNVGIGTSTPAFRLDVAGNVRCTSLTQTSTGALKTNIIPLPHALETLKRLQGVAYLWNDLAPEDRRGKSDIGFIAEQVDAVVPEIVAKDENGRPVGIDYGRITALAVEAVKEQESRIVALEAQLAEIRAQLTPAPK